MFQRLFLKLKQATCKHNYDAKLIPAPIGPPMLRRTCDKCGKIIITGRLATIKKEGVTFYGIN